eukprot:scaffold21836_cov51-Phaeocystis_antarctica.AAC.2
MGFDLRATRLLEHLDRRLSALAPLLGHGQHRRAEHARDAHDAVVEGHCAHAHLHGGQQLVHDLRRRRDHDGVAVPAHWQARQLVHEVQVHLVLRHELAEDLLDLAKDLVGVALDDTVAELLQALEPGLDLVKLLLGCLEVAGQLDAAAILLKREHELVLLLRAKLRRQHLVEDDERRRRQHLGRLEDAPEKHLCVGKSGRQGTRRGMHAKGQTRESRCVMSGTDLASVL